MLKRLPAVCPNINAKDSKEVATAISELVCRHLLGHNKVVDNKHPQSNLYRVFYYDALPYTQKGQYPISKKSIDYSKTDEAKFRLGLFENLRRHPNTAVRLGEVRKERGWILKDQPQKDLINGKIKLQI